MLFTGDVTLAYAGASWADEKDGKPATGSLPPGKGWRKGEPAPVPTPKRKGTSTVVPAKPAAQKPDDGIGKQVSAWARAGIHGQQLAAMNHTLQAARPKAPAPTPPA